MCRLALCGPILRESAWKRRPLAFLAQFALEEMQPFDAEHLLPAHGVLSFFYEVESQPWGFDPQDAGCARVFWFEDAATRSPRRNIRRTSLSQEARFPALHMDARQAFFYPEWEDFELAWPDADVDDFEETRDLLNEEAEDGSRLLGWPEILQNNMTRSASWLLRDIIWATTGAMCRTRSTGALSKLRWPSGGCCSNWGRLHAGISS